MSLCFVCYMLVSSEKAQLMETWAIQATLPNANNLLWTPGVKENKPGSRRSRRTGNDTSYVPPGSAGAHCLMPRLRSPPWVRRRKIRERTEPLDCKTDAFESQMLAVVSRHREKHGAFEEQNGGAKKAVGSSVQYIL